MPTLPLPAPDTDAPLALALTLAAGTCELAPAERAEGGVAVSEVTAALAAWAAGQGALSVAAAGAHSPCDGGPTVRPITAPAGGWAIGLAEPPSGVRADGVAVGDVVPLGEDRRWWHVPPVAAQLAFEFPGGAPPALFSVTPDATVLPPAGWLVTLPQHEARDAPAEGTPLVAALEPPGVVRVVEWDGRVVVVGVLPGIADGQLREGDAAPHAMHATVTPTTRLPVGLTVRVGAGRSLVVEGPPIAAVKVVDPEVARVAADGAARLRVEGVTAGITPVVLRREGGALEVVTVIVSER